MLSFFCILSHISDPLRDKCPSNSRQPNGDEWFGRISAAARVMMLFPTITVRFSTDGAASLERQDNKCHDHEAKLAHIGQGTLSPPRHTT